MTPPIPLLPIIGLKLLGRSAKSAAQLPESLLTELKATLGQWGLYLLQFEHNAQRERAATELEHRFPDGVRVHADERAHPDWPALRAAIRAASAQAAYVQVFGLESWLSPSDTHGQAEPRLRAWNRGRDGFAREVKVPVLLWLRPEQAPLVARWAPDLWSWRSAVHSVSLPGINAVRSATMAPLLDPRWESGIDTRTAAQRHARIDELQTYLNNESAEQTSTALRLNYFLECVALLVSLGDLDRALKLARGRALPLATVEGKSYVARVQSLIADILQSRGELEEVLRIRRDEILPVLIQLGDVKGEVVTQSKIAEILQLRGEREEALRIHREEILPVVDRLGDAKGRAVTQGKLADILQSRGELEEALRIRREEQMPVYERLGDVRGCAITQGQIADILQLRGELEEALRIRREEVLPVFERLGDVRERALTQGRIADILQSRGDLEEALRIRREEELPVYERLGDVRSLAITQGNIAHILQSRGELEEALRIHREEILPVVDRLGDAKGRAVTQGKITDILQLRGELEEALRIRREEELPVFERLGDVRESALTQGKIADILQLRGEFEEALRIRREEELPVYERLGDVRLLLVGRTNLAVTLLQRGHSEDRDEILLLLQQALADAERLRLPEAQTIRDWIAHVTHRDTPPAP